MERLDLRLFLAALLIALPVLAGSLSAQNAVAGDPENEFELRYQLRTDYPPGVKHIYQYTETTTTTHKYADTLIPDFKYERQINYFITLFSPSRQESGFKKVLFNVDSCTYSMLDSRNQRIVYNSQDQEFRQLDDLDLLAATIPLNNTLELTFSPYGELAKIESEDVKSLVEYVKEGGRQALDSVTYDVWLDRLSPQAFAQLADIPRRMIPEGWIAPDSVWRRIANFRADGVDFRDTLSVSVYNFEEAVYTLKAEGTSLSCIPTEVFMHGYPHNVKVQQAEGKLQSTMQLARLGNILMSDTRLEATVDAESRTKGAFKADIQLHSDIRLLGRYEW